MSYNVAVNDGRRSLAHKRFWRIFWIIAGIALVVGCMIVLCHYGGEGHAGGR